MEHELTTDDRYRRRAQHTPRAFGKILQSNPAALSEMQLAVDYVLDTSREIVIATPSERADAEAFPAPLRATFVANRRLMLVAAAHVAALASRLLLVQGNIARKDKRTA